MKKWLLLLVALVAAAFLASPAMGYISVKQTYDGIFDGWCVVTLDQTTLAPDWWIGLRRAPAGPITYYDDQFVPIYSPRQTGRTFNVWTEGGYPWYIDEPVTQFDTIPGYDPFVTIVPQIDKFFYL